MLQSRIELAKERIFSQAILRSKDEGDKDEKSKINVPKGFEKFLKGTKKSEISKETS